MRSSALRRTKRVCGSGPLRGVDQEQRPVDHRQRALDLAAEVGVARRVSTMLNLTSPCWTAVFLAVIVIPFSFSRSIESITRSATSWPLRKVPVCQRHGVDERRLAVVDVGDDRAVAQVVTCCGHKKEGTSRVMGSGQAGSEDDAGKPWGQTAQPRRSPPGGGLPRLVYELALYEVR